MEERPAEKFEIGRGAGPYSLRVGVIRHMLAARGEIEELVLGRMYVEEYFAVKIDARQQSDVPAGLVAGLVTRAVYEDQ